MVRNFYAKLIMGIGLLITFLFTGLLYAQEDTLARLESAYKNIKDANGSFIQTSYIKELDKVQKFRGKFFIKEDKIRWQYTGDFSQTVYLDKDTLVIYDRARQQAIKTNFNPQKYGQLPIALLTRMAVIDRDFEIRQKSEDNLLLIPKTKMGNIKTIEIFLQEEPFPIKSMKVTDSSDNSLKIEFNSVKINTNLKDSIFKFIPKKDDTILTH
ncbi:outer membrane lipoprotein carrier protein LolA [Thermodesulfovibrio sp.]|uniref:LolA family protein n=1 Tax=Thermodesulfovibrio sp. TaxID=2067987 RepID=UPI0030A30EBB